VKAELLFHQRIDYDDGAIVEMVIWRVPRPVPPTRHGLKYSLFYGRPPTARMASARWATTTNAAKVTIGIFSGRRHLTGSPPRSS
jgi:hypothetical protein